MGSDLICYQVTPSLELSALHYCGLTLMVRALACSAFGSLRVNIPLLVEASTPSAFIGEGSVKDCWY